MGAKTVTGAYHLGSVSFVPVNRSEYRIFLADKNHISFESQQFSSDWFMLQSPDLSFSNLNNSGG